MDLRTSLTAGATGHIADHNAVHSFVNAVATVVNVVADGMTNNTAAIEDAIDNASVGDVLVFPPGPIACNPWVLSKGLALVGAGPWQTWFVPLTNTTSPLITVNVTVDSGFGIFGRYGPSLTGIGINRLGRMAGPCLRTETTAAWVKLQDVFCSGGTRSIEHHAPNATLSDCYLWDCSDAMIDMDENGLELHMHHVVMAANVTALNRYIRLTIASGGGLKGALYMDDVTGNAIASVNTGMSVIAPSLTEVPIKATKLVLDNVVGGGPVIDLVKMQSFSATNGWLNGTHGCVRMDGCVNPRFTDMRTRGGTHTFEFVGATTQGFTSACEVFTGPAYKISTANKPTLISVDDDIAGATDISQVTTDPAWFENASRRTWGQRRFQGQLRHRENGSVPPSGFVFLSGGVATVNHPLVTAVSRVRVWHERPGSSPGIIYSSVADNIVGTSFKIRSTSGADNAGVYWEFVGDND